MNYAPLTIAALAALTAFAGLPAQAQDNRWRDQVENQLKNASKTLSDKGAVISMRKHKKRGTLKHFDIIRRKAVVQIAVQLEQELASRSIYRLMKHLQITRGIAEFPRICPDDFVEQPVIVCC